MASLTSYFGTKGKVFDAAKMRRQIEKTLDDLAKRATAEYKKTTETWDGHPDFTVTKDGNFTRIVGTESEVYGYVDHGTRPHPIRARAAPNLAFQVGFTPKTTPNVVGSAGGGSYGNFVYAKEVQHPGTEPRNFSKNIASLMQNRMVKEFDDMFQGAQR